EGRGMTALTLDQAARMVDAALTKARAMKCRPVVAAVLDAGGNLMVLKREDDPRLLLPTTVIAKANAALGLGMGTRAIAGRAQANPMFIAAVVDAAGGNFAPIAGGVLIRDAAGAIVGAMGVGGDVPDNDETCAVHAINSAGFTADPGASSG